MARYLGWLGNAFFFVLCCFFSARTVNAVIGSALGAPPEELAAPTVNVVEAAPSWDDRQVIIKRNLFNASLLAPSVATTIEEDLEATKLPLTLLGTVAALEPENAWAAIEERDTHLNRVVKVSDEIRPGATVLRIERRRVVLLENGTQRELLLAEDELASASGGTPMRPRRGAQRMQRAGSQIQGQIPPPMPPPDPSAAPEPDTLRNPATLFSQARILPKYDNGQMVGVQVNAIKPGSLFEQIGIKNGCVITEMNGIKIDSPEQSAKILLEFVDAKQFNISVTECQGQTTVSYTP